MLQIVVYCLTQKYLKMIVETKKNTTYSLCSLLLAITSVVGLFLSVILLLHNSYSHSGSLHIWHSSLIFQNNIENTGMINEIPRHRLHSQSVNQQINEVDGNVQFNNLNIAADTNSNNRLSNPFHMLNHDNNIDGFNSNLSVQKALAKVKFSPNGKICDVSSTERFDCYPGSGASKEGCLKRGCCWDTPTKDRTIDVPYCFYSSNYTLYHIDGNVIPTEAGYKAKMLLHNNSTWPRDIVDLELEMVLESKNRLHFKIFSSESRRYEVPIKTPKVTTKAEDTDYDVKFTKSPFAITVTRKSNSATLFDTNIKTSPLIFSEQFIHISTLLSTPLVYGLGEQRGPLLYNITDQWKQLSLWNRDQPPAERNNLYGAHPFFINMEEDGSAHGVFLLNSNAMDIDLQPTPAATFRTIGGILDFYVFLGPSPDAVVQQLIEVIGAPILPPYWALGYHQCRWGYGTSKRLQEVIDNMRKGQFPMDTQWTDIDYMKDHLDWTYDTDNFATLPDVVDNLHQHSQRYVIMLDPAIRVSDPGTYPPYDDGLKNKVFIMNSTGQPAVGRVWPGDTVFPDFTLPATYDWWYDSAQKFFEKIPFDGIWIDMNEPSNFVAGSLSGCPADSIWDNPPYTPGIDDELLASKTLCPSYMQYAGRHYDLHNLYGYTEAVVTNKVLQKLQPKKRPFIISRSTFIGQGIYSGHWTGDNYARWEDMKFSIAGILNFQLFGMPMVGADICGFQESTNEELCVRWYQLAVFYPFMRNHNTIGLNDQDPTVFSKAGQDSIRHSLHVRYSLLPYLYTLFYVNHLHGTPVARPMAFQYPTDLVCLSMDTQLLWGSSLMLAPVLQPGISTLDVYFPSDRWYDYYSGKGISPSGGWLSVNATMDHLNLYIRGGSILPTQPPAMTTVEGRIQPFGLVAALCEMNCAHGELYWDDGELQDAYENNQVTVISYKIHNNTLHSTPVQLGYIPETGLTVNSVQIYGVQVAPQTVLVNGKEIKYSYNVDTKALHADNFTADMTHNITISWY